MQKFMIDIPFHDYRKYFGSYRHYSRPNNMASAAKKRKLSCMLLENCLPVQIVQYCIDPYFISSRFDRVVAHLQFIFNEKSNDSVFQQNCHDYVRADGSKSPRPGWQYNSLLHCIFSRIELTRKWYKFDVLLSTKGCASCRLAFG